MALILDVDSEVGITAQYHRIAEIKWDCNDKQLKVLIETYIDAKKREAGAKPLKTEWVWIPSYSINQDIRAWVYPLLKDYYGGFLSGAEADDTITLFNPEIKDDGLRLTIPSITSEDNPNKVVEIEE